jgi:hypothetical protein
MRLNRALHRGVGQGERLRVARIASFYEGTKGIQALDLVARTLSRDCGRRVRLLLDETASLIPPESSGESFAETYEVLATALEAPRTTTEQLPNWLATSPESAVAGATNYLALWQLRRWVAHRTASHNCARVRASLLRSQRRRKRLLRPGSAHPAPGIARSILADANHLDAPPHDKSVSSRQRRRFSAHDHSRRPQRSALEGPSGCYGQIESELC